MTAVGIPSDRTPTARSRIRFLAFAVAVVAVNALLVGNYALVAAGPAPEWPVMIDLLVFVPLVIAEIRIRRRIA